MDWFATWGLVFGGSCSNAITLERVTSEYPRSESPSHFLPIPRHLPAWTSQVPHILPRAIQHSRTLSASSQDTPYTIPCIVQVGLFYTISLLNNLAFGYSIHMPVHIIFRSGELVISLLMGWLISGKSYTSSQVLSVLVVTTGVILATLSSYQSHKTSGVTSFDTHPHLYLQGIAVLTLALILSSFLGVVQDKTFTSYAKSTLPDAAVADSSADEKAVILQDVWEESMLNLHFLSLPVFLSVRRDLAVQVSELSTSVTMFHVPLVVARITLPTVLPALLTNTLTQLLCVAGVNRLTTRAPTLTVTLVLVVPKAVSLVLSVLLFDGTNVTWGVLWGGAFLVFTGTVTYTVSGRAPIGK